MMFYKYIQLILKLTSNVSFFHSVCKQTQSGSHRPNSTLFIGLWTDACLVFLCLIVFFVFFSFLVFPVFLVVVFSFLSAYLHVCVLWAMLPELKIMNEMNE